MELASFNCPICGELTTGVYSKDGSIIKLCQKCYEASIDSKTDNKVEIEQ